MLSWTASGFFVARVRECRGRPGPGVPRTCCSRAASGPRACPGRVAGLLGAHPRRLPDVLGVPQAWRPCCRRVTDVLGARRTRDAVVSRSCCARHGYGTLVAQTGLDGFFDFQRIELPRMSLVEKCRIILPGQSHARKIAQVSLLFFSITKPSFPENHGNIRGNPQKPSKLAFGMRAGGVKQLGGCRKEFEMARNTRCRGPWHGVRVVWCRMKRSVDVCVCRYGER